MNFFFGFILIEDFFFYFNPVQLMMHVFLLSPPSLTLKHLRFPGDLRCIQFLPSASSAEHIYTITTAQKSSKLNEPFRVATKSRFPCTPGFQLAREIVEGNRLGKEVRQPVCGTGRRVGWRFTFLPVYSQGSFPRVGGYVSGTRWRMEGERGEGRPRH